MWLDSHVRAYAKALIFIGLCTGASLYSENVLADDKAHDKTFPLRIVGPNLPNIFSQSMPGPLNTLYDLLIERSGVDAEYQDLPFRRAVQAVHAHKVDCFYMATRDQSRAKQFGFSEGNYVFLGPLQHYKIQAFARNADASDIVTNDDLMRRKVAVDGTVLAILPDFIRQTIYDRATTIQKIEAVARGEIDVVIGYDYDLQRTIGRLNLSDKITPAAFVLYANDAGISCHRRDGLDAAFSKLQTTIDKMRENGEIDQVLATAPIQRQ